jgi:hypothetical protein
MNYRSFSHTNTLVLIGRQSQAGTLTGEFIVYAAYEGINYYLTLGKHGEYGHIAERIRACAAEFPFLDTLIASQ